MTQEKKTITLKNAQEIKECKQYTIFGRIGEITFYGKDLTLKKAREEYEKQAQLKDAFWEECKETYYTNDVVLTEM